MELRDQLHEPTALPLEKKILYPLNRRLGGIHCQSGRFGEDDNIFNILEIETRFLQSISEPLYRLSYSGFSTLNKNVQ